jgi:hypothetical protein
MKTMKTMKLLFLFNFFIGGCLFLQAQDYEVVTSSFLGVAGDDIITGVEIQSDGTIVMAGDFSFQSYGDIDPIYLDGATTSSTSTVIRMSIDGQQIISITKLKDGYEVEDMGLDGLDNIYVVLNKDSGYVCKISPEADSLLFSNDDDSWTYITTSPSGYFAVVGGYSPSTWSPDRMRFYDPQGNLIFEKYLPKRGIKGVAISEADRTVIAVGFTIRYMGIGEYHLNFHIGYGFNGARRYVGYDWSLRDWVPRNPWNMVRTQAAKIGQDNQMYIFSWWTGTPPHFLWYDPFDKSLNTPPEGGDRWHTNMIGSGQDQKSKLSYGRYNSTDGSLHSWNHFTARSNDGANTTRFPGTSTSVAINPEGEIHTLIGSGFGFPLAGSPGWSGCTEGMTCIQEPDQEDASGANIVIFSNDLTKRLLTARIGGGGYKAIDVRRLNGQDVIVAGGGNKNKSPYILNALQSDYTGGENEENEGYFCVINEPGPNFIPDAPSGLQFDLEASTNNLLSWTDNANDEDGFVVERKMNDGEFEVLVRLHPNIVQYRDNLVTSGNTYEYRVASYSMTGTSTYTPSVSTTVASAHLPDIPSGLTAQALTTNEIRLTWNEASEANGYLLEAKAWDEDDFQAIAETESDVQHYNATGLEAGTNYFFRVRSFNDDGASDYSTQINMSTLDLPVASAVSPTDIEQGLCFSLYEKTRNLSNWSDFSDDVEIVHVLDDKTNNMDPATDCDPFAPNDNSYAITYYGYIDIPESGTYGFSLLAAKQAMLFIDSEVVIDNSSWKWGAWEEHGQVGLEAGKHVFTLQFIQGHPKGKAPQLKLKIKGPSMLEQFVPDDMFYRKTNCERDGEVPDAPTNLEYTELAGNIVYIEWDDNADDEGLYSIEITPVGWDRTENMVEVLRLPANSTNYTFINITPGASYDVRVRAINEFGYSDYSNTVDFSTTMPVTNVPAAPDALTVNFASSSQINLGWNDNSNNESHFVVEYKPAGGEFMLFDSINEDITSATVTGLEPETEYFFRVKAVNSDGESAYTDEVSSTTLIVTAGEFVETGEKSISAYPNPAGNFVYVAITDRVDESLLLTLYDINGGKVKELLLPAGIELFQVFISELGSGIYLLNLQTQSGNRIFHEKIIKQ